VISDFFKLNHFSYRCNLFMQVINDRFGIVEGLMTTVHSITGTYLYLVSLG